MNGDNMTLCVISYYEKGFWGGDIYLDGWIEGGGDGYVSGTAGGTKEELKSKVLSIYPGATFEDGLTGTCNECGEHHFKLETDCKECGGKVEEE